MQVEGIFFYNLHTYTILNGPDNLSFSFDVLLPGSSITISSIV